MPRKTTLPMPPETITRTTRNGLQTYTLVAVEDCVDRKGQPARYDAVWRSACRTCGAPFYLTSGTGKTLSKDKGQFGTVNCPDHRQHTTPATRQRDADFSSRYGADP